MAVSGYDGSIVLTTKIDTKGLGKGIDALKNKFAQLKEQRVTFNVLTSAIKDQQFVIKNLETQYSQLVAAGQGSSEQAQDLKNQIKELRAELKQMQEAVSQMGKTAKKDIKTTTKGLTRIRQRLAEIAKSVFIFTLVTKALRSIFDLFKDILNADKKFRADWEELKAALYAIATPLKDVIIPALKYIVAQMRDWAVSVGRIIAELSGMSYEEFVAQARATKEAADNYKKMADSSAETAKNVKKQLAAFDDIQILTGGETSEADGGESAGFDALAGYDTGNAKNMLEDVMTAVRGALIALGVILLVSGNVGWGISLIIAGAAMMGYSEAEIGNADNITAEINKLSGAVIIGGILAILVGILLCMAQLWGLGIKLIAIGAAASFGTITLNWDSIKEKLQTSAGDWVAVGGIIAIVLGILLCMASLFPIGIALIALGAAAVVTTIVVNWDTITKQVSQAIEENKGLLAGAAAGLLLIGILLCFTPMLALGIALIATGVIGLGYVATKVDWRGVGENISNFVEENKRLIIGISAGLLLIGILLCFTPLLPLGIGLIAAGVAGLGYTATKIDWKAVGANISNFVEENKRLIIGISAGLLVIGILLCFTPMLPLGISLIAAGVVGLGYTATKVDWKAIGNKISNFIEENKGLLIGVSAGLLLIGILLCITGVRVPLGIGLIVAGVAGLGYTATKIDWNAPVNWVKNAWEMVKQFWNANIAPVFTQKFWIDLAKKCGNGLIAGFEGAINGIISLFETMINWIAGGLNKISFDIPSWVPLIGGKKFGFNIPKAKFGRVSIPRLAEGAVIPANKEFLAVLGDQKRGTNIEAPAELIKQMVREALAENGSQTTTREEHYYLNETELMSIMYRLVKGGERLGGGSLITEGGA